MARIISSRKKYVPVKDLTVYPSKTETIEVIPDDGFNGAHRYRARMCAGFVNGKTKYVDATDTIQFVHKHEDGTITPVKYEGIWNNSDEEPEDYEWVTETEIEDVYGIDFMESLPNIDDGEMVEIRIKCTAEKCE